MRRGWSAFKLRLFDAGRVRREVQTRRRRPPRDLIPPLPVATKLLEENLKAQDTRAGLIDHVQSIDTDQVNKKIMQLCLN
jgi:hypothetical protein